MEAELRAGGQSYAAVRHEFVTGDILCFRGRGLISGAIRFFGQGRHKAIGGSAA